MNNRPGIAEKFQKSAKALCTPAALAVCAMLLAVSIVLGYLANAGIGFFGTITIKISFTAIPIALAAMLYGPVPAAIIGALTDIIGFMLMPKGAYMPGFTISMILIGIVYGIAFYGEKITLPRVVIAQVINSVFINLLLGSVWFVVFYGFQFGAALTTRGIAESVMLPLNIALIFVVLKAAQRIPEVRRIKSQTEKSTDLV